MYIPVHYPSHFSAALAEMTTATSDHTRPFTIHDHWHGAPMRELDALTPHELPG